LKGIFQGDPAYPARGFLRGFFPKGILPTRQGDFSRGDSVYPAAYPAAHPAAKGISKGSCLPGRPNSHSEFCARILRVHPPLSEVLTTSLPNSLPTPNSLPIPSAPCLPRFLPTRLRRRFEGDSAYPAAKGIFPFPKEIRRESYPADHSKFCAHPAALPKSAQGCLPPGCRTILDSCLPGCRTSKIYSLQSKSCLPGCPSSPPHARLPAPTHPVKTRLRRHKSRRHRLTLSSS